MRSYVLDSCAVDPIADISGAYEAVRAALDDDRIELLFTHVTLDELAKVPDLDRRQLLLVVLVSVGTLVHTGGFILGVSRLDQGRLAAPATLDALMAGKEQNASDALISATAACQPRTLITADAELTRNAGAQGIEVVHPSAFLDQLGNT